MSSEEVPDYNSDNYLVKESLAKIMAVCRDSLRTTYRRKVIRSSLLIENLIATCEFNSINEINCRVLEQWTSIGEGHSEIF